jgi:hypothetical protein
MNNKIANILKSHIEDLTWIDKIAGLVQTVSMREKIGESVVFKSYPVSCDIDYDSCTKGRYQDLTPNSKKKSVLYFEDMGVSFIARKGNTMVFQSSLRLVCWLNLKLIDSATCDSEVEHCSVSGDYVIEILKALPDVPFSETGFVSINISGISEVVRSVDIFSKYTYNEQSTQFLLWPFDYFGLDLEITFTVPCITT